MTLTIDLCPEIERKLREWAAQNGQDLVTLVHQLIDKGLQAKPTLDEILAPFRQEVAESGMTDEELANFFREVRDEVRQERRAQHSQAS
jgi:hypothetical protein